MKLTASAILLSLGLWIPASSFTLPSVRQARATSSSSSLTANSEEICSQRLTLFDIPVSNNGARCRMVIYYKGIEDEVEIKSPVTLGGLKSPEYLILNPHGKMPLLVTEDSVAIPESDTIARYLMDRFSDMGPTLLGGSLLERTLSNAIARHHDVYIGAIQGCLYKPTPPFGVFSNRQAALADLRKQLDVLEDLAASKQGSGPYISGGAGPTLADCTMLPTAVFLDNMLPKFDTKCDDDDAETRSVIVPVFGPTVQKWFEFMTSQDPVGVRVASEVRSGLEKWGADGRWDSIVGAGVRDHAPGTVFDGILAKTIPSEVVFEDGVCLAFRDVNPVGPVHVLVIPKQREGLTHLRFAQEDHKSTLGHLLWAAAKIARNEGLDEGYRVVINDGGAAAQSVFHLHVHVIGGRQMEWPPG